MDEKLKTIEPADTEPSYMWRIRKAKQRFFDTRPAMDLENAVLLTRSFKTVSCCYTTS